MAPFGLKLWENAFQTIPDISSFDVENKIFDYFFEKQNWIGERGRAGWMTTTSGWMTTTWGVDDNSLWIRTGFRLELGKGREGET